MAAPGSIEHKGIISEVGDKLIRVSVKPESACGNCRARGSCSLGSDDERIIEVFTSPGDNYFVGEQIGVVIEQSLGMKALGLGYVLPFLVVMTILIILSCLGVNEGLAGILSLAALAPYYFGLTFFKKGLKKEFSFRLKKL
jgi:positive regulator of sigma E activity